MATPTASRDGDVIIAGGGVGGLATALALARLGIPSHVIERRPALAEAGAGIQIGPNGTRVLQWLGVADALQPMIAAPNALRIGDGTSGRTLTTLPLGKWIANRHGAPYWTAHRQDLHHALATAAAATPGITLSLDTTISDVASGDAQAHVTLQSGETVAARAVIIADGLWSTLRTRVADVAPPVATGLSAYRSVMSLAGSDDVETGDIVQLWLSRHAHVVHYPVRAGRELAMIVVVDHDRMRGALPNLHPTQDDCDFGGIVNTATAGLAPVARAAIEQASAWQRWTLPQLPSLPQWSRGRLVLLGDAAHPILPFFAQGAVLALEDAVVLAHELAAAQTASDVPAALQRYSNLRHRRAARVVSASARNGRIYHLSGAAALARNGVLAMTPPKRLMAGFDWLYGWRATGL
ncbi:MAG: FAD-dependent monooxygenase [Hyphomicrobium sp.]